MTTARTRRRLARTAAVLVAVAVAGAAMPAAEARPPKGDTARVSEGAKGEPLNGTSLALGLSDDGRYALFSSAATNLLPGGAGVLGDVYVRDLRNGHTERVSVADDGSALDNGSNDAAISGNGRYVVFSSYASNAVPGQPKHPSDVFVRDRWTGRTELLSAGDGVSGAGDDQSIRNAFNAAISADGRYVVYSSDRTDLAPGVRRGKFNVFLADRWTHTTRVVSTGADGTPADNNSFRPTISADGTVIGFTSRAGNLLPAEQTPPALAATSAADPADGTDLAEAARAPRTASARAELAAIRAYPYYVWDARTGKITGASYNEAGEFVNSGNDGRISPSGRYAAYTVFEEGGRPGSHGRHQDVYVRELATGTTTKVNKPLSGTTPRDSSYDPVMPMNDRWVYFVSDVADLVPGDTNEQADVFRTDLRSGHTERVSLAHDGSQSTTSAAFPQVDADDTTLLFSAQDGNLAPVVDSDLTDVFRRRL
ncbi:MULTISPECIES: TolB family protein [Streptomycetaceae]|uniref:TolB family protein n=1 Tax=Streptomycetaceae TaxID=2062 RepID=UPI00093FECDA|nr:PD40 domain-containing protein [Streptomyces sp. CB02056]